MIVKFLQENTIAAFLLLILRLYLGYSWLMSGWGKITGGFDSSGFLKGAVTAPIQGPEGSPVYGWWTTFVENFALPNARVINLLVPWGEFLVGLGLILGCFTTAAAFFGVLMNFSFLLSGTISHNPTDILMGIFIMVAGYNAGRFGLDYFLHRYVYKGRAAREPLGDV
ncbi:DoxX family protein [Caldibacillus lycopersici]|uniref:DoxX family protein n=1 Tax=Perspicuibacillus lycopersici TaxID=1325689 RepID=A0AAE3ITN5_9BACI|nr:DoxX family protein [Perspicuibacillus lycopersici]MCU9613249.1 DoxX family protein [Perspicuibacillus lycopersici]